MSSDLLTRLAKVAMEVGAPHLKRGDQMRCTKDHWDAIARAVAAVVVEEIARRFESGDDDSATRIWAANAVRTTLEELK